MSNWLQSPALFQAAWRIVGQNSMKTFLLTFYLTYLGLAKFFSGILNNMVRVVEPSTSIGSVSHCHGLLGHLNRTELDRMWSNLCTPETPPCQIKKSYCCLHVLQLFTKHRWKTMKMTADVAASRAAGRCDLHLCWRSCQELSSCIQAAERSAAHWHFITETRITVDLFLFPFIVWQACDILTSQPRRCQLRHQNTSLMG